MTKLWRKANAHSISHSFIYLTSVRHNHNDKTSSFEALIEKDDSVSIHNRNLQLLAIEMYKSSKGLSPPFINKLFERKNEHQYNLRHNYQFPIPAVDSAYHGTENVSFLGPKIWDILPYRLKKIDSLRFFKTAIKIWKPVICPCRLCRIYIHNVVFI